MRPDGWLDICCPEHRCGAGIDEHCRNINTGGELTRRPAHEKRLWNAAALELIELDYSTAYPDDDPWAGAA